MITITSLSQTLSSLDRLSSSALCLVILCLVAGIYSRSGSNEFSPLRACLTTGENFYVRMMAVAAGAESPSTLGTVSLSFISSVPSPVRPPLSESTDGAPSATPSGPPALASTTDTGGGDAPVLGVLAVTYQ